MKEAEIKATIDRYVAAYNSFDIDAMMAVVHPKIEFENISGSEVTASASGAREFSALAEQSKAMFRSRRQTINMEEIFDDKAYIDISFEAVLAVDFPNGMKAGETLRLEGRTELEFRDGKISKLTDIS